MWMLVQWRRMEQDNQTQVKKTREIGQKEQNFCNIPDTHLL